PPPSPLSLHDALPISTNFSLSAHSAVDAPPTSPQQGVGGTYNVTVPSGTFRGSFTSKVDCVKVGDDDAGPGTAQATAVVTQAEEIGRAHVLTPVTSLS